MSSYFLGGDASKGYCNFTLLDRKKRIVEEDFQLDDSYEGHQSLCNFFRQFFSSHKDGDIRAGFESTGGYENNWYQLLWKLQGQDGFKIKVARLNPYGVKYHKKASLDRIETDKISARKIADYLITYPDKVEYSKEDFFAELRRHWKYTRILKKQKAQLQTHLKAQLYVSQPQLLVYCKEGMPDWILQLLKKYPTAMDLAKAAVNKLALIPYISKERAKELISEAKRSVASMKSPIMGNIIKSAAREILNMQEAIKEHVKLMISTYDMPEIELLKSFPGIDDYSALGLLLEIGAIERYPSVKNLVSFFGIHPVYRQSGDGKWGNHMSKKGRKEPRWILFNVAKSAICHNEMIQELYNDYLKKGHCGMSALGIIMHKILRIVYGMLKHKKKYDPNVDRANRKKVIKTKQKQESKKIDKSRRYQPYDKNAPVSKRQAKKRELTDTEVVEVVTQNETSSQVTKHNQAQRITGEQEIRMR